MRAIAFVTLAAVLQGAAFAQKTPDPEARNKRAVSVKPHRSSSASSSHQGVSSSARDLEKVERLSIQKPKAQRKTAATSTRIPPAVQANGEQLKTKSAKFSYHPPQSGKTKSTGARSTTSAPAPKVNH